MSLKFQLSYITCYIEHLLERMEVSTLTFYPEMDATTIMIFIILLANIM
jgi:hypothetical protein